MNPPQHTTVSRVCRAALPLGALLALLFCTPAFAQPQPNTGPSSKPAQMPPSKPFDLRVDVRTVDASWKRTSLADVTVKLEIKAGPTSIKTYTAKTDASGVALFEKMRAVTGAKYFPTVDWEGVNYAAAPVVPSEDTETVSIDVFPKSNDPKGLLVTDLMTTAQAGEGYTVFMQRWSIANRDPATFDPASAGKEFEDGLAIQLPKLAEGINAILQLPNGEQAEAKVVEDKVYIKNPIPPAGENQKPLELIIHFSMKQEDPDVVFNQPISLDVEGMRVIIDLQTRWSKYPELDLSLEAPQFAEVGPNQEMPDLRQDKKFLVARGGSANKGGTLSFVVRGYPVREAPGRWLVFSLGAIIVLAGIGLALREVKSLRAASIPGSSIRLETLGRVREDLYAQLARAEESYDRGLLSDRAYDIETARLREELALVLRQLQFEEAAVLKSPPRAT